MIGSWISIWKFTTKHSNFRRIAKPTNSHWLIHDYQQLSLSSEFPMHTWVRGNKSGDWKFAELEFQNCNIKNPFAKTQHKSQPNRPLHDLCVNQMQFVLLFDRNLRCVFANELFVSQFWNFNSPLPFVFSHAHINIHSRFFLHFQFCVSFCVYNFCLKFVHNLE